MNNILVKCTDCNKPFTLTPSHVKWFMDRGLELPKRCKECRTKRHNGKGGKSDARDT